MRYKSIRRFFYVFFLQESVRRNTFVTPTRAPARSPVVVNDSGRNILIGGNCPSALNWQL